MFGGSWNFDLVALHRRPLALHQTVLYVRDHLVHFVEEVSLSQWSILGGLIGRWRSTVEESIEDLENNLFKKISEHRASILVCFVSLS